MKIRYFSIVLFLCILTFSFYSPTFAELPPGAYDELKSNASEYIKIEIITVKAEEGDIICNIDVIYQAKVAKVYRSDFGLQAGDTITIHSYDREDTPSCTNGWGGPQIPDLLSAGWIGNAYLNPSDTTKGEFDIAAYGQSFEENVLNVKNANGGDSNNIFNTCFIGAIR